MSVSTCSGCLPAPGHGNTGTGPLIGTPASISDSEVPHTLAMELEPLDSRISDTTRINVREHGHVRHHRVHAAAGQIAVTDLAAFGRDHHAGLATENGGKL